MRDSLRESLASRGAADVQYAKGSIVLCGACLKPLYRLDRSIFSGDKVSRTASAYRPVTLMDLADLEQRSDVPSHAALVRSWTPEARKAHVDTIPDLKTGDPALCPVCDRSWVRVRAVEANEVVDRAYVWELVTIPPAEPVEAHVARAWVT